MSCGEGEVGKTRLKFPIKASSTYIYKPGVSLYFVSLHVRKILNDAFFPPFLIKKKKIQHPAALQLYQDKDHLTSQHQKLSLGCSVLDALLKGGIPLVGITELAGESSAGKTQISLQLCLCVQYPYSYGGLESGKY